MGNSKIPFELPTESQYYIYINMSELIGEKIKINGVDYTVDFKRALELGVLKKTPQAIYLKHLKAGDIVRYKKDDDTWSPSLYIICDPKLNSSGQALEFSYRSFQGSPVYFVPTFFEKEANNTFLVARKTNFNTIDWVSEPTLLE